MRGSESAWRPEERFERHRADPHPRARHKSSAYGEREQTNRCHALRSADQRQTLFAREHTGVSPAGRALALLFWLTRCRADRFPDIAFADKSQRQVRKWRQIARMHRRNLCLARTGGCDDSAVSQKRARRTAARHCVPETAYRRAKAASHARLESAAVDQRRLRASETRCTEARRFAGRKFARPESQSRC